MVTLHHMHKINSFSVFGLVTGKLSCAVFIRAAAFASVVEISSNYFPFVGTPYTDGSKKSYSNRYH